MRRLGPVAAVLALAVLTGCGSAEAGKPVAEPPTSFTVHGHLVLKHGGTGALQDGHCVGDAGQGYLDITKGTRVTVLNATGRKVAVGKLRAGRPGRSSCTFPFTVTGVPATGTLYFVRVGTRSRKFRFTSVRAGRVTVRMGTTG